MDDLLQRDFELRHPLLSAAFGHGGLLEGDALQNPWQVKRSFWTAYRLPELPFLNSDMM